MAEGRASSSTPWMIDVKDTISFNWLFGSWCRDREAIYRGRRLSYHTTSGM